MSSPTSRSTLISWAKRKLGHPVIQINVSVEQIEDRLDEAIQKFQEYHEDATERIFLKHQFTQEDITNEYISISDDIIGIKGIWPLAQNSANSSAGIFSAAYQFRLNDMFNLTKSSLIGYTITMQHMALLDRMFSKEPIIEFNKHQNRLYLYTDWASITVDSYIIVECFRILDPATYSDIYNDSWLKQYFTALVKLQWGENLSKYEGVQIAGGATLNGSRLIQEANESIQKLEDDLEKKCSEPCMFQVG